MGTENSARKVGIYAFSDLYGKVDDYVLSFLDAFIKVIDDLIIVTDDNISPESREKLSKFPGQLLIHHTGGSPLAAYQAGINSLMNNGVAIYSEMILASSELFGPVFPIDQFVKKLEQYKCDFGGIASFYIENTNVCNMGAGSSDPSEKSEYIYSCFVFFRQSLIKSKEFITYWNRPFIDKHENIFSAKSDGIDVSFFMKSGFKYDNFADNKILQEYSDDPLLIYPLELMKEYEIPFVQKRLFTVSREYLLKHRVSPEGYKVINYLKNETKYDINLIIRNLIRTCNMSDLSSNLKLINIIDSDKEIDYQVHNERILLVLNLFYEDLANYYLKFAFNMPKGSSVLIVSGKPSIRQLAYQQSIMDSERKYKIIDVINRGRDISAILVATNKDVTAHDVICFIHDKKSGHVHPGSIGLEWGKSLTDNLIKTKNLVNEVLCMFKGNPYLGLLVPMPPVHGIYRDIYHDLWTGNFTQTVDLLKKMKIDVPIDDSKDPITGYGTCYWFRRDALSPLFEMNWAYEDFPNEPNADDRTILHAIERVLPFVAQSRGYLSGIVFDKDEAENEILNLDCNLRNNRDISEKQYINYLEGEVVKYYKQTSIKWQIGHRINEFFKHGKSKSADNDSNI